MDPFVQPIVAEVVYLYGFVGPSVLPMPVCCADALVYCGAGIYGMDFYVVLGRRGNRVARRKLKVGRVGASHRVGKEDAIEWFKAKFE
eukprot:18983-Eustigmatos_ZCMA.PRE.1